MLGDARSELLQRGFLGVLTRKRGRLQGARSAWLPDSERLAISTYEIDRTDHSVLIFDPARGSMELEVA
jgi:hypothetical protein